MKKRARSLMLVLLFAAATVVGAAVPTKQVAAAPGECNTNGHSGYVLIDIYDEYAKSSTYKTGKLELYWSNTEGRNCAISRDNGTYWGQRLWRGVWINVSGGSTVYRDVYWYKYNAGPVYIGNSRGKCVDVEGGVWSRYDIDYALAFRSVKHVHCG